jgi:mRNA interferase MazF
MVGVTTVRTGEICRTGSDRRSRAGGRRPVVVVSSDGLHSLPINMIVVVPLTGHDRGLVTHPRVSGERSGLSRVSFARPEDLRAVDASRLQRRLGQASADELAEIRKVMRYFLDL